MSRVVEKTVYTFDELSDEAKADARRYFVDNHGEYPYDDWWQFDDFVECAKCLGIDIDHDMKHGLRIHFSGFSSQGDGASFTGEYSCRPDAVEAIKEHAPEDAKLLSIAERLIAQQVATKFEYGDMLIAEITQSGSNYSHSMTMRVRVLSDDPALRDRHPNRDDAESTPEETEVIARCMRDFADWIYAQLRDQYDWHFSDECLDEELSGCEFDAEGELI